MNDAPPKPARRALSGWTQFAAAAAAAWLAGLIWFAEAIPGAVSDNDTVTDAVVVLTGAAGRLRVGVDVLDHKKAQKLFVSGVYRGVDVQQIVRLLRRRKSELDCCMVLGHTADDTRGNAEETARWMAAEKFTSLRLVTSNYHIRRSILEFRRAMPGIRIVAHPTFVPQFKAQGWWNWPGTLQLVVIEYTKYLVALMRPW
jgi:uncharacterized SAM-binding protein YcdF (DUF218 family)